MSKGWRGELLSTLLSARSTALESLNNTKSDSPPEVILTVVLLWLDFGADNKLSTSGADLPQFLQLDKDWISVYIDHKTCHELSLSQQ